MTYLKTRSSVEIKMHKHMKNVDHIDYLSVYLTEEKLDILGNPLPKNDAEMKIFRTIQNRKITFT